MTKITVDPLNRVEGHLKIEAVVENGVVKEAQSAGTMWRGFENILRNRNPLDAQRITQRICGVCPIAHTMASTLTLDEAFGIAERIPENGRIIRNLILGSNFLQSHILHFYALAALDFVDVTAAADYTGSDRHLKQVQSFIKRGSLYPFFPRYEGDYRLSKNENVQAVKNYAESLDIRRLAHELLAIWGGNMPQSVAIVPGGVTENPTVSKIADFRFRLKKISHFIENSYIPDVLMVASRYPDYFGIGGGLKEYLSYGCFELDNEPDLVKRKRLFSSGRITLQDLNKLPLDPQKITEDVTYAWYRQNGALHPSVGVTDPYREKERAYTWLKAPRYDGKPYEVGPLARQVIAYVDGYEPTVSLVNSVLNQFNASPAVLGSTLGRHAARAIETKIVADRMAEWVLELKPGEPVHTHFEIPEEATGFGITEAPRGSVGHWISIKNHMTDNYQAVVPTTWNGSPRDEKNVPGPIEQALEGTSVRDGKNPFELVRIVRSFDPCLACAVHVVTPKGNEIARFVVEG